MGSNDITSGSQRIRVNVHQPTYSNDTALEDNLYAGNPPTTPKTGGGNGLGWFLGGLALGVGGALLVSGLSKKRKNRDEHNAPPQFPMPYPPDQNCYNQQPYYSQPMYTKVNYYNQQPDYPNQWMNDQTFDDDANWQNCQRNWNNDGSDDGGWQQRWQDRGHHRWNRDNWDM
jgi:hypothetical protein